MSGNNGVYLIANFQKIIALAQSVISVEKNCLISSKVALSIYHFLYNINNLWSSQWNNFDPIKIFPLTQPWSSKCSHEKKWKQRH